MPGKRGIDRDIRRFAVADLADENDVRVLPDNAPQTVGEGHADFCVDLHLAESAHLVFHRIFDGDDFLAAVIELADHAVQCRGLAASGRADNKNHAVRNADEAPELREMLRRHAERLQVKGDRILIQKAQNNALTRQNRDRADAHVKFGAPELNVRAPVLRETAFGDVEPAEQLDARRNCGKLVQRTAEANQGIKPIRNQIHLGRKTLYIPKDSPALLRIKNLEHEIGDTIYIKEDVLYSDEQLIMQVAKGDIDFAVCNQQEAERMAKQYPEIDIQTDISFTQLQSWAVRKDSPLLLDSLNRWLNTLKQNGTYDKIYNKYYKNEKR